MIRRLSQFVLIAVTVSAAWVLRPAAADTPLDLGVEQAPATYVACVGRVERDLASTLAIGSVIRGNVLTTLAAPGGQLSKTVAIDPAGGAMLDLSDVGAAGIAGVLVELPSADAGAAVVTRREAAPAVAACTPASTSTLLALGGSTATGETLDLVLANPYAADAVVSVGSSSESGEDSASEIASILVPAGNTVVRQLETLLPLRQSLTVRMEVQRGAVHAALVQSARGEVAIVEAVEPAQDWWLPALAVKDAGGRLVISTASPLAVDVAIDVHGAGTLKEAVFTGTIDPRAQLDIPVADLLEGPGGIRVSADGPVVATLVVDGVATRAVTPGTTLSTEWVIAGSGSFEAARAWVLNPGEVEAEIVFQPLVAGAPARAVTVPADAAVGVPLEPGGAGYLIRSTSEIAVFWSARQGGLSLATGHPLAVVTE